LECEEDLEFVKFFRHNGCCWRCICLLFNQRELDVYRNHERIASLDQKLQIITELSSAAPFCTICLDVLAKAELSVPGIAEQVRKSGYEYCDFKLTFSISIMAHLKRMIMIIKAE